MLVWVLVVGMPAPSRRGGLATSRRTPTPDPNPVVHRRHPAQRGWPQCTARAKLWRDHDRRTAAEAARPLPRRARRRDGAGKSPWAAASFAPEQVVSSDALRAVVGLASATSAPAPTPSRCST